MKYDVFISYSRKDMTVANQLCVALDNAGISYWIDRNIHGSANFLSEIAQYIKNCRVVVFIASSNSAASPWTQKEILFANKRNKEIVPYRIGDFCFEDCDELDLFFTNVQWIETEQEVITALRKLGCEDNGRKAKEAALAKLREELTELKKAEDIARTALEKAQITFSRAEEQRKAKESEIAQIEAELNPDKIVVNAPKKEREAQAEKVAQTEKTYQVGDYYDNNGIKGVVFEVSDGGRHGKVLSMDSGQTSWCTRAQYLKNITVGAESDTDGLSNTNKVMSRSDCEAYPAFVWCRSKGNKWYLPSKGELLTMFCNKDKINATLSKHGGTKIDNDSRYWSSTEYKENSRFCAWGVIMYNGDADGSTKDDDADVRAAAAF